MPWVIECIEYECLGCEKIWDKKFEWRSDDDKGTAPETKAGTAKEFCKACSEKLERADKESKEKRDQKQ